MQVGVFNNKYCEVDTDEVDRVVQVDTQCREGYFSYGW